ncbi:hypothetical protein JRQ81_007284 [Phrynocephalus forsythii]|uniref:Transcription factor TFIIIC triple barrel domain-containing protein n=1 Tax=Phrynocephalus forsythii TaxID=171643 RepID=A0A9Q0Y6E7_9SAUR|nr:hypothetical protein JRQ81_007284 [Phrynocephalus forsythii]
MDRGKGEQAPETGDVVVEEQLVMVELSGIIDSDFLKKCENKCKILGIDTERPILQVDRYVFAGEYEDTLGTCVVFEENEDHGKWLKLGECWRKFEDFKEESEPLNTNLSYPFIITDAEGNQKLQLKYKCHTMKKLNMTRTLLTEKKEGEENTGGGVEWLELKDKDFSYSRPKMICNFLYEKEEEVAEPQDRLADESDGEAGHTGKVDRNLESEAQPPIDVDDLVPLPDAAIGCSAADSSSANSQEDTAIEDAPH